MGDRMLPWTAAAASAKRRPGLVSYAAVAAASLAVAIAVLLGFWFETLLVLVGLSFVVAVLINPVLALLAWLASAPVLNYYINIKLPAGIPDLTFTRLIVGMLLVLLLGPVALGWERFPKLDRAEKAMLVFTGVGVIACFFGEGKFTSDLQLFVKGYTIPFLLFFIAKHLVRSDGQLRTVLWILVPQAVYLSLIGIYQRFTGSILFVPKDVELASTYLTTVGRATGPFVNSVEFGAVVGVGLLAMLVLLALRRSDVQAAVLWLAMPVAALGIFFSYTRAVWLGMFLAAVGLYFWLPRLRRMLLCFLIGGVLAGLIALPFVSDKLFSQRLTALDPIYSRLLMYPTVLRMSLQHPVFGYGFSLFTFAHARTGFLASLGSVSASTAESVGYPHNEFMHVLILGGYVGLFAYLAVFRGLWSGLSGLGTLTPETDVFGRGVLALFRAVFMLYVFNMFFVDFLFLDYASCLAYFMFGLMAGRLLRLETPGEPTTAPALAIA